MIVINEVIHLHLKKLGKNKSDLQLKMYLIFFG